MALLVRVNVAASAATTVEQQLHWHAGRLLDELETIVPADQRPRSAIRRMLAATPALFQSTRAIAIAPFDAGVATTGADPGAAVNHSTFSTPAVRLHDQQDSGGRRWRQAVGHGSVFQPPTCAAAQPTTPFIPTCWTCWTPRYDDTIEIRF